jgi:alpha-glucosidase (family GH31 glycosyl hydrolase)
MPSFQRVLTCLFLLVAAVSHAAYVTGVPDRALARIGDETFVIDDLPEPSETRGSTVAKSYLPSPQAIVEVSVTHEGPGHEIYEIQVRADVKEAQVGLSLTALDHEMFYGLTERAPELPEALEAWGGLGLELGVRGRRVQMRAGPDTGLCSPYYMSTGGYGLLVEGSGPGHFDVCAEAPGRVTLLFAGQELRVHLFHAFTPLEIMRALARVVGTSVLPPAWALGPWRWQSPRSTADDRFWDGTYAVVPFDRGVVEDILMMEALRIPCSAYWLLPNVDDAPSSYTAAAESRRLEEMLDWLGEREIRVGIRVSPGITGEKAVEALARGLGLVPASDDPRTALLDLTNPDAVAWWQNDISSALTPRIEGVFVDSAHARLIELLPSLPDQEPAAGRLRNRYPQLASQTVYALLRRERRDRGAVVTDCGYTGSQTHSLFIGGTQSGTGWDLQTAIKAVQRAACMGFPFWGADFTAPAETHRREHVARWLAFSCFTPIMATGPSWENPPWDCPWDPGYDGELVAIWAFYAHLRTLMAEYLEDWARHAATTGEPLVRPMWMQFPGDAVCVSWWDQYTLGPDVLVAPVWREGSRGRKVYLPFGDWVSAWEPGTEIRGPREIDVDCALHQIPIFLRNDTDLDLGNLEREYRRRLRLADEPPSMDTLVDKARFDSR